MRATRNVGGIVHPEISRNEWLSANPALTKPMAVNPISAKPSEHIGVGDLKSGLSGNLSQESMPEYDREAMREDIKNLSQNFLSQLDQSINSIYANEQKYLEEQRRYWESELNEYKGKMEEVAGSEAYQNLLKAEREKYEIKQKIDKLAEIKIKMANLQGSLELGLQDIDDQLAPMSMITRRQSRLQKQAQAQIMTLAAIAGVYQEDINMFNQMIDQSITVLQADRKEQIGALETLINLSNEKVITLTKDEKSITEAQIDMLHAESERFNNEAEELRELIREYPEISAKAGISMADTIDEAMDKFSQYANDNPEMFEDKEDAKTSIYDKIGAQEEDDEVMQALKNAYSFVSVGFTSKQREAIDQQFAQMIERNDPEELAEFMGTLAITVAPAAQQNKAFGRFEAIGALEEIKDLLYEYEAEDGDTNIFTGTMEKIANKIGTTLDPQLVDIATQIRMAIMDYRKAVTGAAFTEAESAEYERIFPSIGKVKNVNSRAIDSLSRTFNRNQEIFMRHMIGSKNYDTISNHIPLTGANLDEKNNEEIIDLSDLNFSFPINQQATVNSTISQSTPMLDLSDINFKF